MAGSETSRVEISERPSAIVRIAYHSAMLRKVIPADGEFSAIRRSTTDCTTDCQYYDVNQSTMLVSLTVSCHNFRIDVTEIVCGMA
ncbi:hypothetical protein G5I_10443 [Acromyrmex echinatior]|uniref:Uncharacterized protein n=1 Tax=Acromyrmex echinatior TaxID=103372 RepID=F4WX74_ACREC|nr:hypothetical protein G5I_10443 [Acromyrmex echinatior]